jgi:long-subunit fatty acid transport protein
VSLDFPWVARAGARYVSIEEVGERPKPFEVYDVELDLTYEAWGVGGAIGPTAVTVDPATQKPTTVTVVHRWQDTYGIRAGGGYNIPLGDSVITLRAGAFYESATTDSAYTRVDVNSLPKVAGTVGLGYRTRIYSANVGYAAIGSISRVVTDGDIHPANAAKAGAFVDGDGKPLPAVNNGTYTAFAHVLSLGLEVNFEAFFHDDTNVEPEQKKPTPEQKKPTKKKAVERRRDSEELAQRWEPTQAWWDREQP